MAEVVEDDLVAVRQVRQKVACRPLRRCREVQVAADQERLDLDEPVRSGLCFSPASVAQPDRKIVTASSTV